MQPKHTRVGHELAHLQTDDVSELHFGQLKATNWQISLLLTEGSANQADIHVRRVVELQYLQVATVSWRNTKKKKNKYFNHKKTLSKLST